MTWDELWVEVSKRLCWCGHRMDLHYFGNSNVSAHGCKVSNCKCKLFSYRVPAW